jgi:hypothetical protein
LQWNSCQNYDTNSDYISVQSSRKIAVSLIINQTTILLQPIPDTTLRLSAHKNALHPCSSFCSFSFSSFCLANFQQEHLNSLYPSQAHVFVSIHR